MATTRTESLTNDLSMQNTWTSIGSTRNGTGIFSNSGASVDQQFNSMGQAKSGPGLTFDDYQTCLSYFRFQGWSIPSDSKLVSAWMDFRHNFIAGVLTRVLEYREFDFGGAPDPGTGGPNSVTKGDWVNTGGPAPGPLSDMLLLGTVPGINSSTLIAFQPYYASGTGLYDRIVTGPTALDVVGTTDRVRALIAPGSDERVGMYFANYANSSFRPSLHLSTIKDSTLLRHGGASCQLSDGVSVFVEGFDLAYSLDNVTDQPIASLSTGTGSNQFDDDTVCWQLLSMAVDASDNIWIVGKGGAGASALVVQGFLKGSGYSWTAQPIRQVTVPAYGANTDIPVNNVAACWHPTLNAGTLMVMTSRRAGAGKSGQVAYMVLSCNNLIAGVNPVVTSGTNPSWLGLSTPTDDGVRYANDTGNGLDVASSGLSGYSICWDGTASTGLHSPMIRAGRYTLTSSGGIASTAVWDEDDTPIELQPETKAKVVVTPIGIALCYGDRIHVYDTAGTRIVEGATIGPVLYDAANTDWIYDPVQHAILLYYFHAPRELRRTAFSLNTGNFGAAVVVSAAVGPDGTNPSLRLPRGTVNERTVRIEAGHRSAGAVLSTIVLNDTLNVPPDAPTLTPRSAFNASNPATFAWTFNDDNTDDAQTAFQLQIFLSSDLVNPVHDSGKVPSSASTYQLPAGTLVNDQSYVWRVRTWDIADAAGPYSANSAFQTLSTAITTITVPPADNPADAQGSRYRVEWSTTVIVQAKYRLRLINTQNAATILDTGFVTSTDTFYELTGLQDGITYRVEVTVRNNVDVEALTGTRLITPHYLAPVTPVLSANPVPESIDPETNRMIGGYILLSVENPTSGNQPVTLTNPDFETNTAGWVGNQGAIARVTSQAHGGAASCQLTPNGSSAQVSLDQTSAGAAAPVTVGDSYTFTIWVKSVLGYPEVGPTILWRDAVGTLPGGTINGTVIPIPANVWTPLTLTSVAPAGAVAALLRVRMTGTPAASALLFVDDADFRTTPGNEPAPVSNDLFKRELPNGDFVLIKSMSPNGTYRDYNVRSDREYEYFVRAVV